jgi:methylated-DNA-[protein]-cysteine S-methyltransferase
MFDALISTPIGNIGITCQHEKLIGVEFVADHVILHPRVKISSKILPIVKKFEGFFTSGKILDIPYELHGTPFQRKVWQCLKKIPVGETRTYGELSKKLKTSARAVGMACRRNPLPLVIPCHRVVAANHLGGYCGDTQGKSIMIKQWLLAHEKVII